MGCIQVMVKADDAEPSGAAGEDDDGGEGLGEGSDVPQNKGLPTTHAGDSADSDMTRR